MPANVETMFYVREKPWYGLGTEVKEAPTSADALIYAGLNWEVVQKNVYAEDGTLISGYKVNTRSTDNAALGMKADYEQQAADLTDLLARLNAERAELANGVDKEHPALVAFAKYQNIEKLTREILIELVDHIKVYENGNISVRFKFADELRKIVEYIELNTEVTNALAV